MKIYYWIFFDGMVVLSFGISIKFCQLVENYYVARHRERGMVTGHDAVHPPLLVKFS